MISDISSSNDKLLEEQDLSEGDVTVNPVNQSVMSYKKKRPDF